MIVGGEDQRPRLFWRLEQPESVILGRRQCLNVCDGAYLGSRDGISCARLFGLFSFKALNGELLHKFGFMYLECLRMTRKLDLHLYLPQWLSSLLQVLFERLPRLAESSDFVFGRHSISQGL